MPINDELLYRLLGERLKRRREEMHISQGQLAEKIKVLRTSVTNIEAGRQRPPLHLLYDLCDVLGIEVASILPAGAELARPSTVRIKDIVPNKVGGGLNEVSTRTAEFLQQLLKE